MDAHATNVSRSVLVFFLLLGFAIGTFASPSTDAQDLSVYEIEGTVADEKGTDLDGASVSLLRKSDGGSVAETTSDASGTYKFSLVPAGEYVVSATHDCCRRASVEVLAGGTSLKTTAPLLQLLPKQEPASGDAVVLKGVVKSTKDEAPVAGVRLDIESYWNGDGACESSPCKPSGGSQYFPTETDAAGKFEVEVNRGSAYVRASLGGYDTTTGYLELSADREVSIPLQPADDRTARLFGVLKGEDGSLIANGWVSVSPDWDACPAEADCVYPSTRPAGSGDGQWTHESANPQYNSTQTAKDGSWEMRIAGGRLRATAYADNHLEASKAVEAAAGEDGQVDLILQIIPPDSVTVKGRVVDRETGKPVSQAQVSAENQKWGTWSSTQTDDDGRYELRTKPGYTVLMAQSYGNIVCLASDSPSGAEPASSSIAAPCEPAERPDEYLPAVVYFVAEADGSLTKDFALLARPRAQSEFVGYVLNATGGQAIEGATVTFFNELTRDWGTATTDADGSYKIQVHAGYYSIRIWAPHYFDGVANAEIGEKASQRVDFELTPGEKRYGYWSHGGYPVAAMDSRDSSGPSPMDAGSEGPPMPEDGQNVYEGSGGGLGPYKAPQEAGGSAPALGLLVALVAGLAALALRRRA